MDVRWGSWMLRALRTFLKKSLFLSITVSTLTCLLVFYNLLGPKTGFLHGLTQHQPLDEPSLIPTPTAHSKNNDSVDIELLIMTIATKLEYPPRIVPEEKEVMELDPKLFSIIPRQYLPHIKSPCWYEEFSADPAVDPYKTNLFLLIHPYLKIIFQKLWKNYDQYLYSDGPKKYRLRCLPYFHIIGQAKCGTTDLFNRVKQHPALRYNMHKEIHWWARLRFGFVNFHTKCPKFPVRHYLDLFDLASWNIQESIKVNSSLDQQSIITVDASSSVMTENKGWSFVYKDWKDSEPKVMALDFIYRVNPNAKIIAILRDPVERLYSDYLYFDYGKKTAEDFHVAVMRSLEMFQSCFTAKSLRYCAYNSTLIKESPTNLHDGMYVVFLLDWLSVFSREQILVLQMERYSAHIKEEMDKVFDFLDLEPLSEQLERKMLQMSPSNTRRKADHAAGPMLPATRTLLKLFYHPFNQKLASVLNDNAFLWNDV